MAEKTASLWPEVINPGVLSPQAILWNQAKALEEQTKGLLTGRVEVTHAVGDVASHPGFTVSKFFLAAPAIDYSYELLSVSSNRDRPYPVVIDAEEFGPSARSIFHTFLKGGIMLEKSPGGENIPRSDIEFTASLKKIFASRRVISLAQSLIALASDALAEKEQQSKANGKSNGEANGEQSGA